MPDFDTLTMRGLSVKYASALSLLTNPFHAITNVPATNPSTQVGVWDYISQKWNLFLVGSGGDLRRAVYSMGIDGVLAWATPVVALADTDISGPIVSATRTSSYHGFGGDPATVVGFSRTVSSTSKTAFTLNGSSYTAATVNTSGTGGPTAMIYLPWQDIFLAGYANGNLETADFSGSSNWTTQTSPNAIARDFFAHNWIGRGGVVSTGFKVVAFSAASTNTAAASDDGFTWVSVTLPSSITCKGVAWDEIGQRFIAATSNTGDYLFSRDGLNWVASSVDSLDQMSNIGEGTMLPTRHLTVKTASSSGSYAEGSTVTFSGLDGTKKFV